MRPQTIVTAYLKAERRWEAWGHLGGPRQRRWTRQREHFRFRAAAWCAGWPTESILWLAGRADLCFLTREILKEVRIV